MPWKGKTLRVWSLAEGCLGPGLGPGDEEARSVGPGKQVCTPSGSDVGNHTCHGGLWCRQNVQSRGLHLRSGLVGVQLMPPAPARLPVGFSPEVGWGAGPSEAGPEKAHQ